MFNGLRIPEGNVVKIEVGGNVLWQKAVVPDTPTATQYLYGRVAESTVSYNGVTLPDIESVWTDELKQTYPCVAITKVAVGNLLFVTNYAMNTAGGNNTYISGTSIKRYVYTENEEAAASVGVETGKWCLLVEETAETTINMTGVIWANYQFYSDDGNLTAASEPVHSYSDPDVIIDGVGYVGAVLPELPEWDKTAYPYAVITTANYVDGNIARLYFFKSYEPKIHIASDAYCWEGITTHSGICVYSCKSVEDGWVLSNTTNEDYNILLCENISSKQFTRGAWGNIEFACQTDYVYPVGTVLIVPTDPIPVYE